MCSIKCKYDEQREEILEILKDFKCLDKIRNKIKEKYKKQCHLKEITNEISNNKEFIYYGGFPKYETTNESRNDTLNGEYISKLEMGNTRYKYWLMVKKNMKNYQKNYFIVYVFNVY